MSHMLAEEDRTWLLLTLGSPRMSHKRATKTSAAKAEALRLSVWFRDSVSGLLQFSRARSSFMVMKPAAKNSTCVQIFLEIEVMVVKSLSLYYKIQDLNPSILLFLAILCQ